MQHMDRLHETIDVFGRLDERIVDFLGHALVNQKLEACGLALFVKLGHLENQHLAGRACRQISLDREEEAVAVVVVKHQTKTLPALDIALLILELKDDAFLNRRGEIGGASLTNVSHD